MENTVWGEEAERLDFTRQEMQELLKRDERTFAGLPMKYGDEPRLLENMMTLYGTRIRNTKNGLVKPYFARIDFQRAKTDAAARHYIGKVGMFDRGNDILVTDWRAPVSSLYYNCNLGNASYEAPDGTIAGDLALKRQIFIEAGALRDLLDVDTVSDDELLRPYLGANADNRLKNIVASIQKEQNDIIRRPLRESILVQGVAGSGKTTVALHRIAYLVYNYSTQFKAEQYMVIGPNRFFISYISGVLPDLDVGDVKQLTFEELAANFLGEKYTLRDSAECLSQILREERPSDARKLKTSAEYRKALDAFFVDFEADFLGKDGLRVNGFPLLSREQILQRCRSYPGDNLAARLQMTMQAISARLRDDATLPGKIKNHFDNLPSASPDEEKEHFIKRTDALRQQETGFIRDLKRYLSLSGVRVLALYKSFLQNAERYLNAKPGVVSSLKHDTSRMLSKKTVDFEDLPALVYLRYLLSGNADYGSIIHTVVDEAQDFGVFHFQVLRLLLNKSAFSVFGDLAQGIYSYRAVEKWEEPAEQAFNGNCRLLRLEKSYRTTVEIMEAANLLLRHLGLEEGKAVIRHGEPVAARQASEAERASHIGTFLEECRKQGYRSVALITKSAEDGGKIHSWMQELGMDLQQISENDENYSGGECILTCQLAKGLEFDAVMVCDADALVYRENNPLEMKLLYVAMTRALHKLELLYTSGLPITTLRCLT